MKKQSKPSVRAALCGILTALSVVFMLLVPVVPVMLYCAPVLSGLCAAVASDEFGTPYSLGVYISTSVLSLLLVADKEAVLVYILLAGAYPILKQLFSKLKRKPVRVIAKLIYINTAILSYYFIAAYILGIPKDSFGPLIVRIVFLVVGNLIMLIYDRAIDNILLIYRQRLRKRFMPNQ